MAVKRLGREVDNSHPVLDFKNAWSCISTPQYAFIAWYVIKLRDKFILTV
jgi:hypothetical protein